MAVIYAVANQKGGVGKTQVAISLAAALAEDPNSIVLYLDFDPQGHGTEGVGLQDFWVQADAISISNAIKSLSTTDVQSLVLESPGEKFFVLPAHYSMMELEKQINSERSRESRLLDLLNNIKPAFTHIVIDSPSYFGNLTDNIINAVGIPVDRERKLLLSREKSGVLTQEAQDMLRSGLVVPVQAEKTSVRASEILFTQIEAVQYELKTHVQQLAIVPNLYQESELTRRYLAQFRESFPGVTTDFVIPNRVLFREAYEHAHSVFCYNPIDRKTGKPDYHKMHDAKEMRALFTRLVTLLRDRGENNVRLYA